MIEHDTHLTSNDNEQCSIGFHEPYLQLIKRLLPMMPHPSLDSFFFWNSGSEAVEGAIKMARVLTGRQNIISMQGAYHGRTFGAMAVTKSKTGYSEGSHPLMVCTAELTRRGRRPKATPGRSFDDRFTRVVCPLSSPADGIGVSVGCWRGVGVGVGMGVR